MSFQIDETAYYVGLWFAPVPGADLLAVGMREGGKAAGPWSLRWRIRYQSTGRKAWYMAACESEAHLIAVADRIIAEALAAALAPLPATERAKYTLHRQLVQGDGRAMLAAVRAAPFEIETSSPTDPSQAN